MGNDEASWSLSVIAISEQLRFVGAVRFNSSPLRGRGVLSLKGLSGSAERNRRGYLQGELDVPRVRVSTLEGVRFSDIDCVARARFGSLSKRSRPMPSQIQIRGDSEREMVRSWSLQARRVKLNIPDNATLEASYRQGKVVADNGRRSRSQQI